MTEELKEKLIEYESYIEHHNKEYRELLIEVFKNSDINYKDKFGQTLLIYAAFNGEIELADLLINNYAFVNIQTNEGYTALMLAIINNDEEMANFLLNKGSLVSIKNEKGEDALTLAKKYQNEVIIKLIEERYACVNIEDNENDKLDSVRAKLKKLLK